MQEDSISCTVLSTATRTKQSVMLATEQRRKKTNGEKEKTVIIVGLGQYQQKYRLHLETLLQ